MFFELAFEALEEGECVRGATGEASHDLFAVEASHLARIVLHARVAHGHLAIAAQSDLIAAADAEDGGAVELLHGGTLLSVVSDETGSA